MICLKRLYYVALLVHQKASSGWLANLAAFIIDNGLWIAGTVFSVRTLDYGCIFLLGTSFYALRASGSKGVDKSSTDCYHRFVIVCWVENVRKLRRLGISSRVSNCAPSCQPPVIVRRKLDFINKLTS